VTVAIDPVLLSIGPLAVRWFGLLALVGLGLGGWLSLRQLSRHAPRTRQAALDALAWGLPAGLLLARLVHLLGWWDYYLTHPAELWQLNADGLSVWGGLLGGGAIALARLASTRDPLRGRRVLDTLAPNAALGIAIGRLGAFLEGAGQGLPSNLPWATHYTSRLAATPDFGVPRHPAQVYDGLVALALFVALSRLPSSLPAGSRVAGFFVLYGLARLGLGAIQLEPAFLFGLQIEQLLAIVGIGFGVAYGLRPLAVARRRLKPSTAAGPQPKPAEDPLSAGRVEAIG
jgi:phosphatidylglycerol:prolipoprotein diacylglycerol transferase